MRNLFKDIGHAQPVVPKSQRLRDNPQRPLHRICTKQVGSTSLGELIKTKDAKSESRDFSPLTTQTDTELLLQRHRRIVCCQLLSGLDDHHASGDGFVHVQEGGRNAKVNGVLEDLPRYTNVYEALI
jgi:hypothetical protein